MVYDKFELTIRVEGLSEENLFYLFHCQAAEGTKMKKVIGLPATLGYALRREPVTITYASIDPKDCHFEIRVPMEMQLPDESTATEHTEGSILDVLRSSQLN